MRHANIRREQNLIFSLTREKEEILLGLRRYTAPNYEVVLCQRSQARQNTVRLGSANTSVPEKSGM